MRKGSKYAEITDWLKREIAQGNYLPGDRLPTESELQDKFLVSRQTVRHAIEILEREKLVECRRGSGSYVTERVRMRSRNSTRRIQMIITYVDEYIFPQLIRSVEQVLSKGYYSLQIAFTNNQVDKEHRILDQVLQDEGIDALIVEPTRSGLPNPNLEQYQTLIRTRQLPMVFINSYYPELPCPHVSVNDRLAGKIATSHLAAKGHRKIAAVFKGDDGQGIRRYMGYTDALQEEKILLAGHHVGWADTDDVLHIEDDAVRYVRKLKNCTACVCYNDQVAHRLLAVCREAGLSVPEDISIVGIDNSDLAVRSEVLLTSVDTQPAKVGTLAGEMLIRILEEGSQEESIELVPELVERKSVRTV